MEQKVGSSCCRQAAFEFVLLLFFVLLLDPPARALRRVLRAKSGATARFCCGIFYVQLSAIVRCDSCRTTRVAMTKNGA